MADNNRFKVQSDTVAYDHSIQFTFICTAILTIDSVTSERKTQIAWYGHCHIVVPYS